MVMGHVRGLSQYYADNYERMEIWVENNKANALPYKENTRVPIQLFICSNRHAAGLRSTAKNKYVWICPNLLDSDRKNLSLSRVLTSCGFKKNEKVKLSVNKDSITVEHVS